MDEQPAPAPPPRPLQRAGWGYDPPPPSKAAAVWALILAVVPMCLTQVTAIILAVVVFKDSRDGRDHGKGMAIAALVISCLWIVLVLVMAALEIATDAERDSTGAVSQRGDVSVLDLRVGDCVVNELDEDPSRTVTIAPCDESHRLEAYASFDLSRGDFPGQSSVDRLAEGGCVKRFADYVGTSFDESRLEMLYLRPNSGSWRLGDREVICLVTTGSDTTGSLKGSGATSRGRGEGTRA